MNLEYKSRTILVMKYFAAILILCQTTPLMAVDVALSELVAAAALSSSESIKIQTEMISKDANTLRTQAALAPRVTSKISLLNNRNETSGGAFSPERMRKTSIHFGITKMTRTGTVLGSEYNIFDNSTTYPSLSGAAFTPQGDYKESNFSVFVQQKLLKNSFGTAYRAKEEAAKILADSLSDTVSAKMEAYISSLIQQYYAVWLLQTNYEASEQRLARQQRLLTVTKIKLERGTAEEPDLLQLQSSLEQIKTQMNDIKKGLEDSWRTLVVSLNLPDEYLKVEIEKINLIRETKTKEGEAYCKSGSFPETSQIKSMKGSLDATAKELLAVKNEAKPDLFVEARVLGNGIDNKYSPTAGEALAVKHPQLSVAVGLDWPIGFQTEKAAYLEAFKRQKQAEASLEQLKTNQKIQYVNACADLVRLKTKVLATDQVFKWQKKRNELEEKRFALGQIDLFNVIQAGNDETTAQVNLKSSHSELDLAAWKVLELHGDLPAYIQSAVQKLKKANK